GTGRFRPPPSAFPPRPARLTFTVRALLAASFIVGLFPTKVCRKALYPAEAEGRVAHIYALMLRRLPPPTRAAPVHRFYDPTITFGDAGTPFVTGVVTRGSRSDEGIGEPFLSAIYGTLHTPTFTQVLAPETCGWCMLLQTEGLPSGQLSPTKCGGLTWGRW